MSVVARSVLCMTPPIRLPERDPKWQIPCPKCQEVAGVHEQTGPLKAGQSERAMLCNNCNAQVHPKA